MKMCDVCRCPEEKGKKTIEVVNIEVGSRRWTACDLCRNCRLRLSQWVTDFLDGKLEKEKHDANHSH